MNERYIAICLTTAMILLTMVLLTMLGQPRVAAMVLVGCLLVAVMPLILED